MTLEETRADIRRSRRRNEANKEHIKRVTLVMGSLGFASCDVDKYDGPIRFMMLEPVKGLDGLDDIGLIYHMSSREIAIIGYIGGKQISKLVSLNSFLENLNSPYLMEAYLLDGMRGVRSVRRNSDFVTVAEI